MTNDEYIQREYGSLVGRTIVAVRPLRAPELDDLFWHERFGETAMVLIFDDGSAVIPSADPECNGPGHLILADASAR